MHRDGSRALVLGCLAALIFACFGGVLLRGEQFAFRDAAHFYYPLYQRVQQEWRAGRLPLWEMEENAGMPLLGNPAAAVLYPGKLIYALFPYAWAARLYVLTHVLLAFGGLWALLRHWEVTRAGAAIGSLAYAFGGPVLFQYCNVIFLVGAAWAPWGLLAADRLVRSGDRRALPELAAVLALQVLGGDPETAYLTALCAAGYACWVSRPGHHERRFGTVTIVVFASVLAGSWAAAVLAAAYCLHRAAARWPLSGATGQVLALAAWLLMGLWIVRRWQRSRTTSPTGRAVLAIVSAAALAVALAAVQLVPVCEFAALSIRARGERLHDIYPFSVEPFRALELVWPNVFGTMMAGNHLWLPVMPPKHSVAPWTSSLYLGGATLVLGLGAAGFRRGPHWRAWMTTVALVSFTAALGEYGSPLWWARELRGADAYLGGHDLHNGVNPLRLDGRLQDGDGGLYWLMTVGLPGFRVFRYPGKLLTFTSLSLSVLGAMGWDQVAAGAGGARRSARCARVFLAVTLVVLGVFLARSDGFAAWLERRAAGAGSLMGPLDVVGATADVRGALVHGALVLGVVLLLIPIARRFPGLAAALALPLLTIDLAAANASMVLTLPQSLFEARPALLDVIARAEKADPAPGPFRVHRLTQWDPIGWYASGSPDRWRALVEWRRKTLEAKYGLPYGLEYTLAEGTTELDEYRWFFHPSASEMAPELAPVLKAAAGTTLVYFPRRGFDLWNSRYFILPFYPRWSEPRRGIAAFLADIELVAPSAGDCARTGTGEKDRGPWNDWVKREDWQVLRNRTALPRAWVVHQARRLPPAAGFNGLPPDRIKEILYPGDALWSEPGQPVYDPRTTAWVEADAIPAVSAHLPGGLPGASETVNVQYKGPQRVELEARLDRPGLVVLADVDYPGWRLSIDGRPAAILRVNGLMRGAVVGEGEHRLVYTYEPWSVRVGLIVTLAGLAVATRLWLRGRRQWQTGARLATSAVSSVRSLS
jgi:hypothetical protein